MSANGIKVNSGSNVEVQAETAFLGELDVQLILQNADREAQGFRFEAGTSRTAAGFSNAQASRVGKSSFLETASRVASGVSGTIDSLLALR